MADVDTSSCPFTANRDERKSAAIAAANMAVKDGFAPVRDFGAAREVLRSPTLLQAGAGAEHVDVGDPEHVPVFYLDGAPHRRRRAAIAKFFAPRAINGRYRAVMEATTDGLLARLRADGEAPLDVISFELAVAVASDIVGLEAKDMGHMSRRLATLLRYSFTNAGGLRQRWYKAMRAWHGARFFAQYVRPTIAARRRERREDIISQIVDAGYSDKAILIECMTYATAGMVTTREFIVMCAWHMFDSPDLKDRFVAADEAGQFAILNEILRLEPIAALLYRRAADDEATRYALDLRAVNIDEAVVGACPLAIDPERAARQKQNPAFLSFGDGAHHCPGWQVALHETRVFVDRLLRVPGIHLKRAPDMHWCDPLMSYELRNAVVACDRA